MKHNEFEINKFSGVINSVVNPDPKTSAICTNFDVYSIEGALQTRRGIKKYLDFRFNNLPFEPINSQIIGFTSYFSEQYNREFIIVAVNKTFNFQLRIGYNFDICSFYVYPSFIKVNGEYQLRDLWTEINQFAIGTIEQFNYSSDYKREIFVDLSIDHENINNDFLYWTGVVVDKNTNKVKNTFYVSGDHSYDLATTLVKFELDDDYNIQTSDKIIFVKNYVKIKSRYFGVEDYFGLIPALENINFYINDTGINVLSSNFPVLKICLDFNNFKINNQNVNQVINTLNYILDSNFNDFNRYWIGEGEYKIFTYENGINTIEIGSSESSIQSSVFHINNGSLSSLEMEFKIISEAVGTNKLYLNIDKYNPIGDYWDIYSSYSLTENYSLTNDNNKWYKIRIDVNLDEAGDYRITIYCNNGSRKFEIRYIKFFLLNKINLITFQNQNENYYLQNEAFGNNGFYIQAIVPDLISIEDLQISNNNLYEIYPIHYLFNYYPVNNTIMADRIIVSLNSVNELCIYQQRQMIQPSSINNRSFYLDYKILNRRINEITAYFSNYQTNVWLNYYQLPFYKIQGDVNLQNYYLDGRIECVYSFDANVKIINLTDYLGYEASEELIKKWQIQVNNYIARVETKEGYKYNQIHSSAINGNGVVMNDIFPVGDVIQIPIEGGTIKGLSINKIRNLFILKDKAVYVMDLDTYSLIRLSFSDGLIGSRALASDGFSIYWLDTNGIKASDGTQIVNLTKNVNNLDYLSLTGKENAIAYINSEYKSFEFAIGNTIFSYPYENIIYNTKKTTNFNIIDINQNYYGDIYYLSNAIYKQSRLSDNYYADDNFLAPLVYETNEFDIVKLGEQIPNDTRISINEIFIEYESKSNILFSLIGDGNIIATFNLQASNTRKLERFQIAGAKEKNLFKNIKLRVERQSYTGGNFENIAYVRIYSIGFSWLPQQITRQFRYG